MSLSDLFRSSRHQQALKENETAAQIALKGVAEGGVLSRSQSFGGLFAQSPRRNSTSGSYGSSNWPYIGDDEMNCVGSGSVGSLSGSSSSGSMKRMGSVASNTNTLSSRGSVLGQSHSPNTTRKLLQGLSATWGGKAPPTPRPQKTVAVFQAIEKGLADCICQAQKDISNLRSSVDNLSISSSQQLKIAERYLKRLECQSAKLEELAEQYDTQQRMHEGVRSMGHAYVLCPGKSREQALHSVRHGLQECVDVLVGIEMELERMMGTLMFQIKGIQGFARLCAGDVFEITIRYGEQKWKTKGRILKNEKQEWDNPRAIFKALISENLVIKAMEVKTLVKNVLLGHKYCETSDLFCASPQLMSVNLNPSGSLKLHLIVTWNPLHCSPEEMTSPKAMPPLLAVLQTPILKRRTPVKVPELEVSDYLISPSGSSSKSGDACSVVETPTTPSPPFLGKLNNSSHGEEEEEEEKTICPQDNTLVAEDLKNTRCTSAGDNSECCSLDQENSFGSDLQDLVHSLLSTMEDIQGQYPELHLLELHLNHLDKILTWSRGGGTRKGSTGSGISVSIENALGCFDFLNTAIDGEEIENTNDGLILEKNNCLNDRDMTAKTNDSGVASLVRQLGDGVEDRTTNSSPCHGPTTGSKQLDQALIAHLTYCQKLTDNLGSFGPLKCREIYSLDKLRRQASIVGTFLALLNDHDLSSNFTKSNEPKKVINGAAMLPEGSETRRLWEQLTKGGDPLCVVAESLLEPLENFIKPYLSDENTPVTSLSVSKLLLCRIVDVERFEPDALVTNLQWQLYLSQGNASLSHNIKNLILEASLIEALHSPHPVMVKKALTSMQNFFPPSECLITVGHLLLYGDEPSLSTAAEHHIQEALNNPTLKKRVLTVFLEGLESENPLTRQAACVVLAMAKATEYTEQLVFICYADDSGKVRQQAKEALFSFGSEGRLAFEQAQLFTHGFQGLGVR